MKWISNGGGWMIFNHVYAFSAYGESFSHFPVDTHLFWLCSGILGKRFHCFSAGEAGEESNFNFELKPFAAASFLYIELCDWMYAGAGCCGAPQANLFSLEKIIILNEIKAYSVSGTLKIFGEISLPFSFNHLTIINVSATMVKLSSLNQIKNLKKRKIKLSMVAYMYMNNNKFH